MYVILKMPTLRLNKKTKIPYYFSTTVSIFEFYIFYMFSFFFMINRSLKVVIRFLGCYKNFSKCEPIFSPDIQINELASAFSATLG